MEKEFRTPSPPPKNPSSLRRLTCISFLEKKKQTFILRYSGKHQVLCAISEHLILSKSKNLPNKKYGKS